MSQTNQSKTSTQQALGLKFQVLEANSDTIRNLYDIVDQFRRGLLQKPPHQRAFIWPEDKRRDWVDRIRDSRKPVGVIVTYQVASDGHSPKLLNDGVQRISATLEYLQNPDKYGDDAETAEAYVRTAIMPVQHRVYDHHEDALVDFQQLNLGTHLTALEFCQGILTYMPRHHQWAPILEEISEIVSFNSNRIVFERYKQNRARKHRNIRHDLALFHRFASNEKGMTDYNAGQAQVNFDDVHRKKNVIEWKIRQLLEASTIEDIRHKLGTFRGLIERETGLFINIWHERLDMPLETGLNSTLYRFLLDCAIWKRHNGVHLECWEDFIQKVLHTSGGKSQLVRIDPDGRQRPYTLSLSRLSILSAVCEIIESPFYDEAKRRRSKHSLSLKPGFDESHIHPFATHGDGPVIGEPASRNRARGARPIPSSTSHSLEAQHDRT